MSDWTYWICDTQTGVKQAQVFPATTGWSRLLNTFGSNQTVFPMLDEKNASLRQGNLSQPWRYTLVHDWRGKARYAGVILVNEADLTAGTITMTHEDIRTIFARRTTLGANGYGGVGGGRDVITNKTLDSIAAKVIADGMVGPMPNYALPIILPPQVTSVFSRTYRDWNFPFVDQILDDLQDYLAGPDTEFDPSWTADGKLQWTFRSGYLTGPSLDFYMNVPEPALFDVSVTTDAQKQTTEYYAVGEGSEEKMKVAYAHVASSTLPALVTVEQAAYKQVNDQTELQGLADGNLSTYKAPTVQWDLSMKADGTPGLSDLVNGATHRLYFKDHWWAADGWKNVRMIGFSGDHTNKVKLTMQSAAVV